MLRGTFFFLSAIVCSVSARQFGGGPSIYKYPSYDPTPNTPSFVTVPLGGNILPATIYYYEFEVGTPSRSFNTSIDTGSAWAFIYDASCDTCSRPTGSGYSASASSTSVKCPYYETGITPSVYGFNDRCSQSASYETCDTSDPGAVCTISGDVYGDVVSVGGVSGNMAFTSVSKQTTNFDQFNYVPGIGGVDNDVAFYNAPDGYAKDIPNALYNSGAIGRRAVGICLQPNADYPQSGAISFGDPDPSLYTGDMAWLELLADTQFYEITVDSLTVSSNDTSVSKSRILNESYIVDSGTNFDLLDGNAWKMFNEELEKTCKHVSLPGVCDESTSSASHPLLSGTCVSMYDEDLDNFPILTWNMTTVDGGSVTVVRTGRDYLIPDSSQGGCFVLGLQESNIGLNIFGDVFMHNYYMVFDLTFGKLGIAAASPECFNQQPNEYTYTPQSTTGNKRKH